MREYQTGQKVRSKAQSRLWTYQQQPARDVSLIPDLMHHNLSGILALI